MLDRFAVLASTGSANLFRAGGHGPAASRAIVALGIRTVYRLCENGLPGVAGASSILIRRALIDPVQPDPDRVRQIVHVLRGDLLQGQTVLICDATGRDRVSLIAGAWRILQDRWSLAEAVQEWHDFGAEFLPAESFNGIRECLIDIAEGIDERGDARD